MGHPSRASQPLKKVAGEGGRRAGRAAILSRFCPLSTLALSSPSEFSRHCLCSSSPILHPHSMKERWRDCVIEPSRLFYLLNSLFARPPDGRDSGRCSSGRCPLRPPHSRLARLISIQSKQPSFLPPAPTPASVRPESAHVLPHSFTSLGSLSTSTLEEAEAETQEEIFPAIYSVRQSVEFQQPTQKTCENSASFLHTLPLPLPVTTTPFRFYDQETLI